MKQEGEIFLREQVQHIRAAVIGDVMADRYIFGSVNRISPEAPVPVNLVQSEKSVLGGAANTAANLAALGCRVYAAGMRGEDENGKRMTRVDMRVCNSSMTAWFDDICAAIHGSSMAAAPMP